MAISELDENAVNCDGLTYKTWLKAANRACQRISGVTLDDLPDGNSWDAWHGGESSDDYARDTLEEEGYEFEESD